MNLEKRMDLTCAMSWFVSMGPKGLANDINKERENNKETKNI